MFGPYRANNDQCSFVLDGSGSQGQSSSKKSQLVNWRNIALLDPVSKVSVSLTLGLCHFYNFQDEKIPRVEF